MDVKLPGSEESNISANLNETTSSRQPILNPQNILTNIRLKNLNRFIFAHLSINKFEINLTYLLLQSTRIFMFSQFQKLQLTPLF